MNSSLTYKNILVTLLRDKSGRHAAGFPTEDDFILEISESALRVLTDEQIIASTEAKLRRAADHVLHSQGVRELCAQSGRFTWDDFVGTVNNALLSQLGMRRFESEETIARHVAIAVDRDENLMPDLSDGHVYVYVGRHRRRLVATVTVDLQTGVLSGKIDEPVDPAARYVLAFKDHDELVPLIYDTDAATGPRFVIAGDAGFASKSEEESD